MKCQTMNKVLYLLLLSLISVPVWAQDNYEIQVYGSETLDKHATMLELHSNFTFGGTTSTINKVLPTHHILHETIEVTHGFTDWLEVGFYVFNAIGNQGRTNYVGSHIRPRVMAPERWHWPVGVSLSVEGGFQKLQYAEDDWSLEIRPIVDKKLGKIYLAFNPTLDKSLHGLNQSEGFEFSPNIKVSYDILKAWSAGIEYYGAMGQLTHFSPYKEEQHQLFIAADANFSENWEVNFGYGWGFTSATDKSILKLIVGYRFR